MDAVRDSEKSFDERVFVLINSIAIAGVAAVTLVDLIIGENHIETIGLLISDILVFVIALITYKLNKTGLGGIILSLGTIFFILPMTFFYGGGLYGGAVIWIVFGYLYIGFIVRGRLRTFLMFMLSMIVVAEYLVSYHYPDTGYHHTREVAFLDSAPSVIIVGIVIFIMVLFQNKLYMMENEKAMEEAKKVEDLNKAQNRFFSSMSHEIRTPINTILGLNEIMLRDETLPDEVISNNNKIQISGKMLLAVINDI